MQTNPEQWADDVRYLAKLADWAAGEGFCQLENMDDPDEWCALKWDALNPDANGTGYGYSADALGAALIASIQAAFAEREARLVGAIQDRDILIAELIAKAAVAVLFGGDEFWQRFHDEAIVSRTTLAALKDRTHG